MDAARRDMRHRKLLIGTTAVLVVLGGVYAAKSYGRRATPAERYRELAAKYGARSFIDDDQAGRDAARQFLAVAREAPDDPSTFDALEWVVRNSLYSPETAEAMAILAADHVDDPRSAKLLRQADLIRDELFDPLTEWAEAAALKCTTKERRAEALLIAAMHAKRRCERREWEALRTALASGSQYATPPAEDRAKLATEAAAKLQRVVEEYGWLPYVDFNGRRRTFGTVARSEKDRLPMLIAPDISGDDANGSPMRLSDFRGRVVILTFTAEWTGDFQRLNRWTNQFKHRPAAIVAVHAEAKEALRSSIDQRVADWNCWWDRAGGLGPIYTDWNVRRIPTTYLIDAKGLIRFKDLPTDAVPAAVEALLNEAEANGKDR
jgi:peroxiredoxin